MSTTSATAVVTYKPFGSKSYAAEFGGRIDAMGTSKAEATRAVIQHAADRIADWAEPSLLQHGTQQIIVTWAPQGWYYVTYVSCAPDGAMSRGSSCYGFADRADAIRNARRHLAQMVCREGTDCDEHLALLVGNVPDLEDHQRMRAWQDGYREAATLGMDDEGARSYADAHRYSA